MKPEIESAIVRIPVQLDPEKTAGMGFLVGQKHVLTCAHVVNACMGKDIETKARPSNRILLELAFADPAQRVKSRVVGWSPYKKKSPERGDDIALLELAEPAGGGALPVSRGCAS